MESCNGARHIPDAKFGNVVGLHFSESLQQLKFTGLKASGPHGFSMVFLGFPWFSLVFLGPHGAIGLGIPRVWGLMGRLA